MLQRRTVTPRPDWQATIERQGLVYWATELPEGRTVSYWNEEACYVLPLAEVEALERAANQVFTDLLVPAGDKILADDALWRRFGIPEWAIGAVRETWEREAPGAHDAQAPSIYGRYDFGYTADGDAKLLEFNADTPTSLLEAAVVQWNWKTDVYPDLDQWNSLHERLAETKRYAGAWRRQFPEGTRIHFAYTRTEQSGEDAFTTFYLADTAKQAGMEVRCIALEEIGFNPRDGFVDLSDEPIAVIFKLWPWEWLLHNEFGRDVVARMGTGPGRTRWIEPIYKMLWSNKAILPVLWEMFPGHPNLLPAYFDEPRGMRRYVRKPLLSREGANIDVVDDGEVVLRTGGEYGAEGFVCQEYADLPVFDGRCPVLGVWMVDGECAGLGIRESDGPVTNNLSYFVPHVIDG
jgi:glutathionylspermidine synthase